MKHGAAYLIKQTLVLIALFASVTGYSAQIGDSVDYLKGIFHGKIIKIEQTPAGTLWTAWLDEFDAPIIDKAENFAFCDPENRCRTTLLGQNTAPKKHTLLIQNILSKSEHLKTHPPFRRKSFLISFKGHLVPIQVEKNYMKGITQLAILGEREGEPEPCLEVLVNLQKKTAELSTLRTQGNSGFEPMICPIPTHRSGSYLLDLVDALSLSLDLTKMQVYDASEVACTPAETDTSLQVLRLFQKGAGWYESKGYLPDDLDEYLPKAHALRSYSIQKLLVDVDQSIAQFVTDLPKEPGPELLKVSRRLTRKAALFHRWVKKFHLSHKSDELGTFLGWLWDQDCSAYTQILDQLLIFRTEIGSLVRNLGGENLTRDYRNFKATPTTQPELKPERAEAKD